MEGKTNFFATKLKVQNIGYELRNKIRSEATETESVAKFFLLHSKDPKNGIKKSRTTLILFTFRSAA